ncbi:MAG: aminotransferase class V-fold PLP-dependent enzyme [Alphaproteobacteria bacterium]|jgi:selenocysteine lyase/cysteine desulfurase|nr:aminotransferase class V-fold PLP-dependent enzyme [Alphaproteobacteria bacterium]
MIPCQRDLFDLPEDVAYLRCAAVAPQMKSVHEAALASLERRARPWGSDSGIDFEAVDELRGRFAGLIGAAADDIAIVPAASYGLGIAAANVAAAEGEKIIVLENQFPSNVYPWRQLAAETGAEVRTVPRPADSDWTPAVLEAIGNRAAAVALANCHWNDGSMIDLAAVAERTRAVGAALVLDLSQSCGAVPFDVAEIRPDFLVSVGQKWLMGPSQLAYLYVAPERQQGRPIEFNWVARAGAENPTGLADYTDDFQPGARRYDGGGRGNPLAIPMANTALAQIQAWGVAEIAESIRPLVEAIAEGAKALGLEPTPAPVRAPHFLGLRVPGGLPAGIAAGLGEANVHISVRGDSIRVAPNVYNNEADVARLLDALAPLVRN